MIKIKNLNKKYLEEWKQNYLYKDLNFEVDSWDFVVILWRSWSWKTTLLNMISWLVWFDSWEITIDDTQLSKLKNDELTKFRWKNLSFIFQQFHLIPNLTVKENVELVVDINKIDKRFEVSDILKRVWLEEKINSYPFNLSWWEQQRVAIARSFLWVTPILLADEPTWNLDKTNAKKVMEILKQMHKETKNTIVLITHDKNIASYANKAYEIKNNTIEKINIK